MLLTIHTLWAQMSGLPRPELITARQGLPQAFVPAVVQDKQGFIWMATRDGLCRYDGQTFRVFQPTPEKASLSSSAMAGMQIDTKGRLWIISEQRDLDIFDPFRETFINFSRLPFFRQTLSGEHIERYYPDPQNCLWMILGSKKRLVSIDLTTHDIHRFDLGESEPARAVQQDRWGTTWVATKTDLYQQDKQTQKLIRWSPPPKKNQSLSDTNIRDLHNRPDGSLLLMSASYLTLLHPQRGIQGRFRLPAYPDQWRYHFATDSQGNTFFELGNRLFRFNPQRGIEPMEQLPGDSYCRSLFIDRSDVLWMGTNGQGIRKYNLRATAFNARPYQLSFQSDLLTTHLGVADFRFPVGSSPYNFRYTFDKQGGLWFNAGTTPFYRLDLSTKQVSSITFPATLKRDVHNQPASLATDPDGQVWAIHDSLVVYYQEGRWKRFPFSIRSTVGLPAIQLVVDRLAIWLATVSNGLYRVDRATGHVRHYASQPGNVTSLSRNELICLFADPLDANLLWIGTFGSGLCRFDKRTGRCRRLTTREGLPNNVVYSAIPDRQRTIWVGTNQGLCRVDRRTLRTRTYTQEDGLQADEFNRFHTMYLPGHGTADDRIILGGVDGITAFDPKQIREDTYQPHIQLTTFQVNNRPLSPVRDSMPVHAINELDLTHDQNFITIGFAVMQYNRQTKMRYRYWLEGVNSDWVYSDRPIAEYTGLSPGSYLLRLNASNTSGHWSPHIRTLRLIIHPPWWATGWAYGLYGLLILGIGYVLARQYRNRLYLQQSVAFKQKEAAHLREIDAMKTRFFTNITHEFRTPLTLILAPVEQMMQEARSKTDQRRLNVVDRNAHQLLGLINQLLDLSRLESGNREVAESRGHINEFIEERILSFGAAAETKGIHLSYQNQLKGEYWFDANKLERILYNLVANALKFTPVGGTVTVTVKPGIYVVVSDTGVGIPSDQLDHIFDRFYQVKQSDTGHFRERSVAAAQPEGTGIGLTLVKELVGLQGGSVDVKSRVGAGSTFTVFLPYRLGDQPASGKSTASVTQTESGTYTHDTLVESVDSDQANEPPVVLLVEDNLELLEFITSSLPDHYQIYQATNGQQGLEEAFRQLPDLIISDVMMPVQSDPEIDGFELCRTLKEDQRTNHIPVILLTARGALESRLEGLRHGADDYLTKPFHLEELRLRVANLLERQRRLRDQLRKTLIQPDESVDPSDVSVSSPFLETLYQLLESNLDDSSFSADDLAAQAYLSRMHLHRKLKTLTGLTTSDFIRTYRLKRAAQLLVKGEPISQTAYAVGFESPAYFSRSFRQLYGMTPSDYITQNR